MERKKLILIDGHALVHRAFHALPPLTSPKGAVINAVYGFAAVLLKILKDFKPEYVAATFDLAAPTFRHEEFADYKAHREKAPDELYAQIPMVKEMLTSFGIPIYEKEGFEADDMIGSLAIKANKEKNLQVIIMTGDLDTLQLVKDDEIVVCTLKKGVSDTIVYNEDAVRERYGLAPAQLVDFKGLKGDPSDNIPGVPGIGEKTASTLMQAFGTLEKLYEAVENGDEHKLLTAKLRQKLIDNKDMALFSKRLATIILDVPNTLSLEEASWHGHVKREALEAFFKDLGMMSLLKRLPEALGEEGPTQSRFSLDNNSMKNRGSSMASPSGPSLLTTELEPVTEPETVTPGLVVREEVTIGYDLKPLVKKGEVSGKLFDIRIAAWLLAPDARDYDFATLFSHYLGRQAPAHPSDADMIKLKDVLWDDMKQRDLLRVFEDIEMPLIPVLAAMENRGITINTAALAKLLKKGNEALAELETKIYEYAGGSFNINSPAQMGDVLFEKLALKGKVRKTGGGARSTAAPELEKLREEHPIIDLILEYRELQKLKTTYIEPFPHLVGEDKRIHTTYNQTGAATGRLSSQDPNLQNIPTRTELGQQFRAAFIAQKGYKLVAFDYTQLELRIVAHLAQDQTMIEVFRRGEDIHTRTAAEIFKVAPEAVTKDMRRTAKVLNFGIIYGMGQNGFARASGVSRNEARAFIDAYFQEFKGIARYMEDTKRLAAKQGFVVTLFGRRRPLPEITSTMPMLRAQAERMAINHPVQGTEADLIKLAMIAVAKVIENEGWESDVSMLLQVHDELVFEVKDTVVSKAAALIKESMEKVFTLDVPLTVDAKAGDNWSDMEDLAIRVFIMKRSYLNKLLTGAGIAAVITFVGFVFWFFDAESVEVSSQGASAPLSRLTGQPCEAADQRPTAVMLAGDPVTRPLSGIGQADMVIEMPVTPQGVTRFMAVFQCEHPSEIGSIRSAREDFLPLASGLGVLYAHWGGEHGSLEKLNKRILDNIDALKYEGTTFHRKAGIPMPHNGFSTLEKIADRATKLKYPTTWEFAAYPHAESKAPANIASLTTRIDIGYPAPFNVRWEYDTATRTYRRLRNGTPEQDGDSSKQVAASVVIIMKTTASPLRDQYLIVDTQGSGEALIHQQGTVTKATWRKDPGTLSSKLLFVDAQGKEIPFTPGKIWINIVAPL